MTIDSTPLPGVLLATPLQHGDSRGWFMETWRETVWQEAGMAARFVQENASRSAAGTLRGLHFQHPHDQGKLVRVTQGSIFDVAVDIRRSSPTFGRWYGCVLDDVSWRQLWVPPGFAHGFLVLSEIADVSYKCTEYYHPEHEQCIRWDDPDIGIAWPLNGPPLLSHRDREAPVLRDLHSLPTIDNVSSAG